MIQQHVIEHKNSDLYNVNFGAKYANRRLGMLLASGARGSQNKLKFVGIFYLRKGESYRNWMHVTQFNSNIHDIL